MQPLCLQDEVTCQTKGEVLNDQNTLHMSGERKKGGWPKVTYLGHIFACNRRSVVKRSHGPRLLQQADQEEAPVPMMLEEFVTCIRLAGDDEWPFLEDLMLAEEIHQGDQHVKRYLSLVRRDLPAACI